jgi:two-component system chemotaxis sensor kinase CheA
MKAVTSKDREFQEKLLATFRVEAGEHVNAFTAGLIALEKTASTDKKAEILESLIREAHSLKGAARAVGGTDIEKVCQSLESVLAALKGQKLAPSLGLFDTLHGTGDCLRSLVTETEDDRKGTRKRQVAEIVGSLEMLLKVGLAEEPESPTASPGEISRTSAFHPTAGMETARVSTAKLDAVLRQAEELLSAGLATDQQIVELRELQRHLLSWKKEWAAHRSAPGRNGGRRTDRQLEKLFAFFEGSGNHIESIETAVTGLLKKIERSRQSVAAMVDTLLEDMKKVSMQPFSTLLEILPKLVRDLSRDQGKEVELVIRGAEIEIDKRILEEMKDPLIHLVRNCVDHGIEAPDERRHRGKRSRGTITVTISQTNGGNVELLVEDDGTGIDVAKVKSAAARLGILSREEAEPLGNEEAFPLIFRSGVSTSATVTDVSGRGIGLAIAQEKVEKLGGGISVHARPHGGTIFRITLPLTLAIFRGIFVQAGGRLFAFPTSGVERVVRLNQDEIRTVENRETFSLGGRAVPLVKLEEILGISGNAPEETNGKVTAVVLAHAEKRIAVLVDEVIDEGDMLVKNLGSHLRRVPNVAGATVLGTGKIVPVLLVPDVMKSAALAGETGPKPHVVKKYVLVVEDSITSRMLLKNILETAGYEVGIAVDGIDAFTKLRSGGCDIVVSDVQMPRMNGFDLTSKIRADKKLAEIPIVLVTAMESREDRERGIEVGANAYIVKSSFDQGNLLEAVRRLL